MKPMKLAIVGKGGVGKTTLAGTLARLLAREGYNVLAIDADPNINLASSLGIPEEKASGVKPLAENIQLIRERVQPFFGGIISFTPKVDDVVDKFGILGPDGVKLLVMGTVRSGGSGCMCPENTFLRALLSHILLGRRDVVILDMVAGLEHLGRGTARGVDLMLCVVEPTRKSIETARRIYRLAREINIREIRAVGNKVLSRDDESYIRSSLERLGISILGYIPFDDAVIKADMAGKALIDFDSSSRALKSIERIKEAIVEEYLV